MKAGLDTLVLRLTNRCNLTCAYCYAEGCAAGEDLPPELATEAVARACPPGGWLHVQFTGGEPLLRWDTARRVLDFGQATGRQLYASLQTNGTLLTPELCREIRERQVAVGVSLDGVALENGARVFSDGAPSFPAVVRGLQTLAEAGMTVNLTAVVTAVNAKHLDRLLDFGLWCGNIYGVGLDLIRPQGRGTSSKLSPSPQALEEGLNRLLARHDQLAALGHPVRLKELERLRLLLRTSRKRTCYCNAQTGRSLAVTPDGRLWPCSALAGAEGCLLGRLDMEEDLPEQPCPGLELAGRCVRCPAAGLCGGGCPASRLATPSPLDCRMHRKMLEHACRLEGKIELWNTWETAFPDREEANHEEELQ